MTRLLIAAALLLALLAGFALARYLRRNGWIYVSCYRAHDYRSNAQ